jgi:uncharacterized membrane protein YcaP (DUF421 family)
MAQIKPFEVERMLFGEAPPEYLIEIFCRGLSVYLFMFLILKLLGKRLNGKMTIAEMVLIITLGGSAAVAMQVPEGGVFVGCTVLLCAALFEYGFARITRQNRRLEKLTQGNALALIKDGVLNLKEMKTTSITKQQIFGALRHSKIYQLGQVERLYMEASGEFGLLSIEKDPPPGLPIFPPEGDNPQELHEESNAISACRHCGATTEDTSTPCRSCGDSNWTKAIK